MKPGYMITEHLGPVSHYIFWTGEAHGNFTIECLPLFLYPLRARRMTPMRRLYCCSQTERRGTVGTHDRRHLLRRVPVRTRKISPYNPMQRPCIHMHPFAASLRQAGSDRCAWSLSPGGWGQMHAAPLLLLTVWKDSRPPACDEAGSPYRRVEGRGRPSLVCVYAPSPLFV